MLRAKILFLSSPLIRKRACVAVSCQFSISQFVVAEASFFFRQTFFLSIYLASYPAQTNVRECARSRKKLSPAVCVRAHSLSLSPRFLFPLFLSSSPPLFLHGKTERTTSDYKVSKKCACVRASFLSRRLFFPSFASNPSPAFFILSSFLRAGTTLNQALARSYSLATSHIVVH